MRVPLLHFLWIDQTHNFCDHDHLCKLLSFLLHFCLLYVLPTSQESRLTASSLPFHAHYDRSLSIEARDLFFQSQYVRLLDQNSLNPLLS